MLSVLKGPWLLVSVLWLGMGSNLSKVSRQPASKMRSEQFVLLRVVAVGLGEGDAVLGVVGQAHAEAVGLDACCRRRRTRRAGSALMRGSRPLVGSPGMT